MLVDPRFVSISHNMGSITDFVVSPSFSLILHILVEIPATVGFLLFPSATLPQPQAHAHSVIRQYGLLLGCTNLIIASLIVSKSSMPVTMYYSLLESRVAGALALYHLGPLWRAASRLHRGEKPQNVFARPILHFVLHAVCLASLTSTFVGLY
jgi:hypothetical protein